VCSSASGDFMSPFVRQHALTYMPFRPDPLEVLRPLHLFSPRGSPWMVTTSTYRYSYGRSASLTTSLVTRWFPRGFRFSPSDYFSKPANRSPPCFRLVGETPRALRHIGSVAKEIFISFGSFFQCPPNFLKSAGVGFPQTFHRSFLSRVVV